MAKRTPAQVYQDLTAAGLDPTAARIMTAIAGGESSWDDTAQGDLNLQNQTWGPSYGLYQIRTLKSETGRGTDRDISWLAASDANQAKAAYDISKHGVDFTPWSVFTTGRWRDFLGQVQSATANSSSTSSSSSTTQAVSWGPDWLPWNWGNAASNALGGARTIAIEGVFVVLGLALVGGGIAAMLAPGVRRKGEQAAKLASVIA